MWDTISVLVASALTLMIYSFLYGENPFFRVAEYTFIAVISGYAAALAVRTVIQSGFIPLLKGNYVLIIPILLGFFLFARFSKERRYLSIWSVAALGGIGTGLALRTISEPQIIKQLIATIKPLIVSDNLYQNFINIFMLVTVVGVLTYFIFTKEHKGYIGGLAYIGRLTILVALGSAYGNTVMGRMSLLIGRIAFLETYPAFYMVPVAIIILLVLLVLKRKSIK